MSCDQSRPPFSKVPGYECWRVPGLCLALASLVLAIFGQTTNFEFINYDDEIFYGCPEVAHGLTARGVGWAFAHGYFTLYQPLTMISFMLDRQIYGLGPGGYHFTNVLLHTGATVLLFLSLRQMTGAVWRSAFVAAVFAIHPLRAESVAWVAERKDVLSGCFFMLTLWAYVCYARKPNSVGRYFAVVFVFGLALCSKPAVVTLPFVLLLLDIWPLRRTPSMGQLVVEKLALLALAFAISVVTIVLSKGEIEAVAPISIAARFGNAFIYYVVYLRQTFWPQGLAAVYPYPANGFSLTDMMLAGLLIASLSIITWLKRRTQPWLLVGWLWYLGMLTPMIGIIPVGVYPLADRYTYLAQIGVIIAATWFVAEWELPRALLGVLAGVILAGLMICSWRQTAYWRDSETLWTQTLACTRGNFDADFHLGLALDQKGHLDDAIFYYREAIRIKPDNVPALIDLGGSLVQKHQPDEAIADLSRAVQLQPDVSQAHANLGRAFLLAGRVKEAVSHFEQAIQLAPTDALVKNNLAWVLATSPQASVRDGRKAVQLAREAYNLAGNANPQMLRTLAAALAETGQFHEAAETGQQALDLAEAQFKPGLAKAIQAELQLYRNNRPFHTSDN